jgi:hypothetical protein
MNHLLDIRALYLLYDFPDVIIFAKHFPYIVCNNQNLVKHGIHLHTHSNVRNVQATLRLHDTELALMRSLLVIEPASGGLDLCPPNTAAEKKKKHFHLLHVERYKWRG